MTAVLPAAYQPLPFAPARGVPQRLQVQVAGRALTVILVAMTADLVGLLYTARTQVLVDGAADSAPRATSVGADPRAGFTAGPPGALDTAAVRPYLIVADSGRLIGSAPVIVGRPMPFGSTESSGLRVEVLVAELRLAAGSLIGPADVGARIVAGIRDSSAGGLRHLHPAPPKGNPYDLLV
ncbi:MULTISPECIES: hypothetical protein [unclassified Streptomyces]|uniref:hypothetical protein n=1 Tax=unclassified Streptomyces TaxID=2593676 RepID=UPI002033ACFE|nr:MULTISPECIES: hypothetical protein [unclassified Streptomyces]MCM2422898.1 hypothetical protein [Streptomyces sp. RKAG293]MCM2424869.1 hypothetical protein [Streptomyces sp. RKAG337]